MAGSCVSKSWKSNCPVCPPPCPAQGATAEAWDTVSSGVGEASKGGCACLVQKACEPGTCRDNDARCNPTEKIPY